MRVGRAPTVLAVTLHRPGAAPERRELAGTLRAGGSQADDLVVPGAPAAALQLVASPCGAVVEPVVPGVRVGGRVVPPGGRRLLRPGERAELRGAALVLERTEPAEASTRAGAASLLRDAAAGTARAAGVHLVVLSGPSAGACHPLRGEETLGRGRRATLRVPDPQASRVHARLRLRPEGVVVEDLSSRNGVRVNGVRVDRTRLLRPGDVLAIGETDLALADPGADGSPRARLRAGLRRVPAPMLAAALLALSAALALAASRG